MASTIIGLDVGTNAVRAAEISSGTPPVLRGFGQVGLPPGAVHEGEVVDVAAVADAIRKLWSATGFTSKTVRVGLASPRVIVRVVELPALSTADTRSALGLQLDEYVPLAAEDTVFDFEPVVGGGDEGQQRLVLAATHRDAVRPLIDAVREAGLKIDAVDVLPAALARALADPTPPPRASSEDGTGRADGAVDLIVSIGAGTVVVVAASDGVPVFSRTITSVAGVHMTQRIAAELSVSDAEAERMKRSDASDGSVGEEVRAARVAQLAVRPVVDDLVEEIVDSVDYYLAQDDARVIGRVLVTGGGSQQAGLIEAIAERLHTEVVLADPFRRLRVGDIGYDEADLPFLAPYMPAAVGLAFAGRDRAKHLDLTPDVVRSPRGDRRLLVGACGALLILGAGWLYLGQRSAVGAERAAAATAEAELAAAQAELVAARAAGSAAGDADATARSIVESTAALDLDWLAVAVDLDAINVVSAVTVDGVSGSVDPIVGDAGDGARETGDGAADDGADDPTADVGAPPGSTGPTGRLNVSGTAADATVVAGWIDAVLASPRVASAWVDNIGTITADDGSTSVEFTAQLTLTDVSGVARPLRGGGSA